MPVWAFGEPLVMGDAGSEATGPARGANVDVVTGAKLHVSETADTDGARVKSGRTCRVAGISPFAMDRIWRTLDRTLT